MNNADSQPNETQRDLHSNQAIPSSRAGGSPSSDDSSVRLLVIGDPHFKVSNATDATEMVAKCLDLIEERRPDAVICLGDVLDRHGTIDVEPLTRATEFFARIAQQCPLYIVIGNHDRPNNSDFLTNKHPFPGLRLWPNTTLVDRVETTTIKGQDFVFVPYVPPGRFEEALNTGADGDDWRTARAIFAHQEFYGAKMGAITSDKGDVWPLEAPLVISGHIHDYDQLQPNLIYVGTPFQHSFGDRDDKTVSFFTFPPVPSDGSYHQERIDLQIRKKVIVHRTPETVFQYRPRDDQLVKLVVDGTTSQLKAFMKHPQLKSYLKEHPNLKLAYRHLPESLTGSEAKPESKTHRPIPYLTRLYHNLDRDPRQVEWFTRLFGQPVEV